MFENGFIREVESLRKMGYSPELKTMKSIGYKQVNMYIDNQISLDDAKYQIKRDTRRYAKRQLTWMRKVSGLEWFSAESDYDQIVEIGRKFFDH